MGKLNVVLDWFANTNHTGFLLAEKRGYFAEAGLEVHIDGEVHGVMDLHGADFVLGPQISMLDCMSRGVELTGVAVLTQRSDSGIVSLKESGITSPRHLEGKRLTHWAPRWFHGVIGEAVRLDGGDYGKVELVPMDVGDIVATLGTVADATWVYANWENEELIAAGKEINFINLADVDPLFDFCAPAIAATHQVLRDRPAEVRAFLAALDRGYQEAARDPEGAVLAVKDGLPAVSEAMLVRSQRHLAPCCWISGATGAPSARSAGSGWPTGWWPTATTTAAAPPSTPMTSSPSEVGRITLERVTFRYLEQSKRPVLDEVSASFDRSRITVPHRPLRLRQEHPALSGGGDLSPERRIPPGGTVRVEGQEPAALGPGERCALVGMLFQNPELQFCMDTVENELFFCLENRRVPRAEMEERLSAALDFCGIAHLRRRPLRSPVRRGEKQRAALACLAALRPAWVLLDEPFANLDDQTAAPSSAGSSPGSTGNAAPAFWPSTTGWTTGCPSPTRSASWPRTARWTAPPMPPAPSPLRRGRSGASASPAAPTRPPGRSRPGRRRWCSPCGACGSPRMGARCCGT